MQLQKQPNNQITERQPGLSQYSRNLQKISKDLTADEVVMLSVKYQSKRIADMTPPEVLLHAKGLIARISIITGWVIPDDQFYFNTLISEFQKFLIENYSDLNPDEIGYAFRTYGTTVKDWGKSMNLSLIDEPINKYLAVRKCLSEMEDRKTISDTNHLPMYADWKENCEVFYQKYLTGKYNVAFWPHEMYEEFVKAGMIASDVYEDFLERAKGYLISRKKSDITREETLENRENILNALRLQLSEIEAGNEQQKTIQWAKRFAIQFLYYKANESGYKNLFVKE